MTTARGEDILIWLADVLAEHDMSMKRRDPLLLASSLAERERWMPLVQEVFKAADGVLIDAVECGDGTECGDIENEAARLVAHIRELLDGYNGADPGASLSLRVEDGRAWIEGSTPLDSVNAAQRAFREVVTAFCDVRLRTSELVALAYAEDALDDKRVAVVWESLMGITDFLEREQTPTTLCVIAGDSKVRPDIHCSGERSLRYRIDNSKLQIRHAYANSAAPVRDLGRQSAEALPLIVLFLGAGASVADGLPTGDALRDKALSSLMRTHVDRTTFEEVASKWYELLESRGKLEEHERGAGVKEFVRTLTLERVLEYEQDVEGTSNCTTLREFATGHDARFAELSKQREDGELVHDPMARLCATRGRIVMVTVNFDRFIEARGGPNVRAYFTPEQLDRFPKDLAEYAANGGPIPLLKLHGSIEEPDTLVATIGETNAGLSASRQRAIQALVAAVNSQDVKHWWYLGYSMRDRDLENIWKGAEFAAFNEHWVTPFLDPNVDEFIKKHRMYQWSGRGYSRRYDAQERLVSLTSNDFLAELATIAETDWA